MTRRPLILTGAVIVDGTGSQRYHGDLWIEDGYVIRITPVATSHPSNATIIPVEGQCVTPGFIDVHSHADNAAFLPTPDLSKILQGVTTEVPGNCGESLAPRSPAFSEVLARYTERLFPPTAWNGTTFAEYWDEVEQRGLVTNVAPLVGQGTLRILAMGMEQRAPTKAERQAMRDALKKALDDGAFGFSTGLIYPPGIFTDTEDIIELAKELRGRLYVTHMRNESDQLEASVLEALAIGQGAGVPVQISHHKAAGRHNWGKTKHTLALIEAARQRGQEVRLDVYPYTASSTMLTACLPPWMEEGDERAVLSRLQDPAIRLRLGKDIDNGLPGWENELGSLGPEGILISTTATHTFEGHTLADVAQTQGIDALSALCQLLLDNSLQVSVVLFSMDEGDLKRVLRFPWTMIGSDGLPPGRGGKPHPRLYGTFPRVLGHYVRETSWLTLETAVYKMTGLPAETFGLRNRGVIREGSIADLVVFSYDTIADRGKYAEEPVSPRGISRVFQSGQCVVNGTTFLGPRGGKRLRPTS